MITTLLDVSQSEDLRTHALAIAAVEAAASAIGVEVLIAGAFARDLHLWYVHKIPTARRTDDVDFGVAVADWSAYDALQTSLVERHGFRRDPAHRHRLDSPDGLRIDLVPFDGIEEPTRSIVWPPRGDTIMDVFGFKEALATAVEVRFSGDVRSKAVTLPALVLLKLVAWQERHVREPKKDAHDLQLITERYLECGQHARLFSEFVHWVDEAGFDLQRSGARLLGHDIGSILDGHGRARISAILERQSDDSRPGDLPGEMLPWRADDARATLKAILRGLNNR